MTVLTRMMERRAGSSLNNPSADLYAALVLGTDSGLPANSGLLVNQQTALRNVTVYTCVRIIAEAIGALPLQVYRRGVFRQELRQPADRLIWGKPNPEMTRQTFWETLSGHCLLDGNAYIHKVKDRGGALAELWPINPQAVTIRRDERSGAKVFDVGRETFTRDDICHIPAWGVDGLKGLSPIAQAKEALGIGMGAEQGAASFYAQGSAVPGFLSTKEEISDQQASELARRWQKLHAGARNMHKVGVLGNGATWQSTGLTPGDAQFLDTMKYSAGEIATLFRIPPHMLGIMDKTSSWGKGLEEQSQGFVTYTLGPWLSRFEQAISDDLLPVQDRYAQFDLDAVLRGRAIERWQVYQIARTIGVLSKNDIRTCEELPPIADPTGDDYEAALNSNVAPPALGNGGDGGQGQGSPDGSPADTGGGN